MERIDFRTYIDSDRHVTAIENAISCLNNSEFKNNIKNIILFGSLAKRKYKPSSDVDLLIVINDEFPLHLLDSKKLRIYKSSFLKDTLDGVDVDLHFVNESDFNKDNIFYRNIQIGGKIL